MHLFSYWNLSKQDISKISKPMTMLLKKVNREYTIIYEEQVTKYVFLYFILFL